MTGLPAREVTLRRWASRRWRRIIGSAAVADPSAAIPCAAV